MSKLIVSVVTPDRIVLTEEADMVVVNTPLGELGILANHMPIVTTLEIGAVRVKQDGATKWLAVSGGFIEFVDNQLSIIAPTAESADSIDLARAEEARKRAERRLAQRESGADVKRAQLALQRALNRIKIAKQKSE